MNQQVINEAVKRYAHARAMEAAECEKRHHHEGYDDECEACEAANYWDEQADEALTHIQDIGDSLNAEAEAVNQAAIDAAAAAKPLFVKDDTPGEGVPF